jgi:hypothetical protein
MSNIARFYFIRSCGWFKTTIVASFSFCKQPSKELYNLLRKGNAKDADGRIKNIITDESVVIKGEGDKPYTIK